MDSEDGKMRWKGGIQTQVLSEVAARKLVDEIIRNIIPASVILKDSVEKQYGDILGEMR